MLKDFQRQLNDIQLSLNENYRVLNAAQRVLNEKYLVLNVIQRCLKTFYKVTSPHFRFANKIVLNNASVFEIKGE